MRHAPKLRWVVLPLVVLLFRPAPARGQVTLEAHGAVGYASVDIDTWAGSSLNDWTQVSSSGYAQVFFGKAGPVALGVEGGYQKFFWYNVRIPFGTTTVLRDRNVTASRVMVVARFQGPMSPVFGEVALGAHMFDGFTDGGAAAAVGYKMKLGPMLSLPIKVRADLVNDSSTRITAISASAGLSFGL